MADLEQLVQSVVKNSYPKELAVAHSLKLSQRLQLLVSNGRQYVVKNERDHLVLRYWTALFEYHQGILTLLRNENPTSAAALLRVFEAMAMLLAMPVSLLAAEALLIPSSMRGRGPRPQARTAMPSLIAATFAGWGKHPGFHRGERRRKTPRDTFLSGFVALVRLGDSHYLSRRGRSSPRSLISWVYSRARLS